MSLLSMKLLTLPIFCLLNKTSSMIVRCVFIYKLVKFISKAAQKRSKRRKTRFRFVYAKKIGETKFKVWPATNSWLTAVRYTTLHSKNGASTCRHEQSTHLETVERNYGLFLAYTTSCLKTLMTHELVLQQTSRTKI